MKDSGALPDDLCLNYVRLDFANNNDNTSFSRHLSHKKIIVMMMMMMMTMMTRMLMMIATMMMLIMMATKVKKQPSRFLSEEEHDWHGENERALVATRKDRILSLESS